MLIDDRTPPFSESELPPWEPDLRLWGWIFAAIGAAVVCFLTAGFVSFVALCVAFGCAGHALARALPYSHGLREYRQ